MDCYYVLELLPRSDVPYYITETDRSKSNAGYDMYISEVSDTDVGHVKMLSLGTKARMLKYTRVSNDTEHVEECHYWLCPRSSIYKKGVMMVNSVGIIDLSYRGELKAPIAYFGGYSDTIKRGDRLFQIVAPDMGWIKHVRIVANLNETERGVGGFGSTGT